MAGASFDISVDAEEVFKLFRQIKERTGSPTEALQVIGSTGVDLVRTSFRRGASPYGEKWAPLKPSTIANRRGTGTRPLQRTRVLLNSFNYQPRTPKDRVRIGTPKSFYIYHQGDPDHPKWPGQVIPQRSALPEKNRPLPDTWAKMIREALTEFLTDLG